MTLRKVHRTVGILFAPFFYLTAFTGIALLFRKSDWYGKEAKETMIGLHNWEILNGEARLYLGVVLAAGLICMTCTGLALAVGILRRKRAGKP